MNNTIRKNVITAYYNSYNKFCERFDIDDKFDDTLEDVIDDMRVVITYDDKSGTGIVNIIRDYVFYFGFSDSPPEVIYSFEYRDIDELLDVKTIEERLLTKLSLKKRNEIRNNIFYVTLDENDDKFITQFNDGHKLRVIFEWDKSICNYRFHKRVVEVYNDDTEQYERR